MKKRKNVFCCASILLVSGIAVQTGLTVEETTNSTASVRVGCNWDRLLDGTAGVQGVVTDMVYFDGDLYVAGSFDQAGDTTNVNSIARWDGTEWFAVGDSGVESGGNEGTIYDLEVFDGDLYAGGSFDDAGGVEVVNIAKWTGSAWQAVGDGLVGGVEVLESVKWSGEGLRLYAANASTFDFDSTFSLAAYITTSSSTWIPILEGGTVAGGDGELLGNFHVMYAWDQNDDDEHEGIYFGGNIGRTTTDAGVDIDPWGIMRWDGTDGHDSLTPLNDGVLKSIPSCEELTGGTVLAITEYDHDGSSSTITQLFVGGVGIYMAGPLDRDEDCDPAITDVENILRWDGSDWHKLNNNGVTIDDGKSGQTAVGAEVHAFFVLPGIASELYVGGFFDEAGTTTVNGIAKYTQTMGGWAALDFDGGVEQGGFVYAIMTDPSQIKIGGYFDKVDCDGTTVYNNIAEWDP